MLFVVVVLNYYYKYYLLFYYLIFLLFYYYYYYNIIIWLLLQLCVCFAVEKVERRSQRVNTPWPSGIGLAVVDDYRWALDDRDAHFWQGAIFTWHT